MAYCLGRLKYPVGELGGFLVDDVRILRSGGTKDVCAALSNVYKWGITGGY